MDFYTKTIALIGILTIEKLNFFKMSLSFFLNSGGLLLNLIGTIILAFSISNYLTSMHGAIAIHDLMLKSIIRSDRKLLSADVGNLLKKGVTSGRARTVLGLSFIAVGFVLQLIPFIIILLSKK